MSSSLVRETRCLGKSVNIFPFVTIHSISIKVVGIIYVFESICLSVCVCVCLYLSVCLCVCLYLSVCLCVCLSVCLCVQDKNTDFHRYLSDGDAVVVYAYPEVIKTPKYQDGKSVALQTFALQMNPKSLSPAVSQSQDLRSFLPPKRSFQHDPNDLRHTLNKRTPQEDPNDLRHVISAAKQDLRAVIDDSGQQQQSGVREVMLSDVTSPTASTAPRKQSSPLTGADAQLERDIYEVSRKSRSPLLHVSQCCA